MFSARPEHPFQQLPDILFSFFLHLNLAAFSASFLITYLTFDERFSLFLGNFRGQYTHFLILTVLVWLSFFWLIRQKSATDSLKMKAQTTFLISFVLFSFLLLTQFIMIKMGKPIPQIDFFNFLVVVYLLYSDIRIHIFEAERPAWRHPTTAGIFTQSVVALAAVWGILFFQNLPVQRTLGWILLITILFRILTMWSRLKYLNRASKITHQTVQLLLNQYLMLFTVRFVFGLIMPLVYLVWGLWFSRLPFQLAVVMVVVGELSDRILFHVTALPAGKIEETIETL